MKKALCIILSAVLITGLCACGGSDYKIVCTSTTPPFNYQTKAGGYDGIDQAILSEISEALDLKYELEYDYNMSNAIESLRGEKYDTLFGCITKTEDTENKLDFSEAYYTDGIAFVTMQSKEEIASLESLQGKNVAVASNSNCYYYIKDKAADLGFELIVYKNPADIYNDLPSGAVDAYIEELSSANYLLDSGAPMKIIHSEENVFEYAFAFPKGKNEQLRADIDKAITQMKADGTLDEIRDKYKTIIL